MQNEKINVDFVQVSPKSVVAGIKPTQAELEAFLKTNGSLFRIPEQLQVRYLAFMAQDYTSTVKISDADLNDYYERNKAQWKKGNKVQSFAEVRDRILAEMGQIEGMYAASDEAKKAHDTIYQQENFDAYAAQKKLTVHTTDYFRISETPPEFKPITDFIKTVSRLEKNEISRVLKGEKGYYVVQLATRKAPYVPALKEVEAEVEKQYREAEAKRLAKKEADDLLARLKKGDGLAGVAKENKLKITETGLFQPGGAIPKLGASPELTEALYQISEKKPCPEQTYLIDGNYVVLYFKERGSVDDAAFASQKNAIANSLIRTKRAETVKSWIEGSKATLIKEGRLKLMRDSKDL
jgi:peptidyl-prolyl cis-trans isomerase D